MPGIKKRLRLARQMPGIKKVARRALAARLKVFPTAS
jgi:hypothetical protein